MNLTNELLGIHSKDTSLDSFEWCSKEPKTKTARMPDFIPLEVQCRQRATKLIGDAQCEGCPALHRGICLKHHHEQDQARPEKVIQDKQANKLMADLAIQTLQGRCYSDLKEYVKSRYTQGFLTEKLAGKQEWLRMPGFLGLVMIDTDWFGSCSEAAKRCAGHPFLPSYVQQKDECSSCEYSKQGMCSKIGPRIFSPGDTITSEAVIRHITELVSRNFISSAIGSECKEIARSSPLHGLAAAVRLAKNPVAMDETNFIQDLQNLGTGITNTYVPIFENEPEEQKEMKSHLYGPEMVVEIDPLREYEKIEYFDTLSKGSGIDGYLQTK